MNKNVLIAVLGAALIVALVFLIGGGRDPGDPRVEPTPTPTPTPDTEKTCEYRTVLFKWEQSKKTEKYSIFAHPEKLDGVQDCAEVIFVNLSDKSFTIKFKSIQSEFGPLFTDVEEISLESNQEGNQYSKYYTVDVELPINNDVNFVDFDYVVDPDGPPEAEQSPRIRVGPRTVNQ